MVRSPTRIASVAAPLVLETFDRVMMLSLTLTPSLTLTLPRSPTLPPAPALARIT